MDERPAERFVAWGHTLMPDDWHAAQATARPTPRPEHEPQGPGLWAALHAWWRRAADDGPPLFVHSQP